MKHIGEDITSLFPPEVRRHRDICRKLSAQCKEAGHNWVVSSLFGIIHGDLSISTHQEDIDLVSHVATLAIGGDALARRSINLGFYPVYVDHQNALNPIMKALQQEPWFNPSIPGKQE